MASSKPSMLTETMKLPLSLIHIFLVLFLDGLDLKIADALARAHERDRAVNDHLARVDDGALSLIHI